MKQILRGMVIVMVSSTAVLAQTKTPIVSHVITTSNSQRKVVSTPTHLFNVQLMNTVHTINKDVKSGKLTQTQAQTLREKVKAIRVQEFQFFKENGNKQLISDQLNQLNQSLSQLSSSF